MDQRHKTNAIYWPAKYTGIKEFNQFKAVGHIDPTQ